MQKAERDASTQHHSSGSVGSRLWRRGNAAAELVAGAVAGSLASFILLPIDTIKVRLQLHRGSVGTEYLMSNVWRILSVKGLRECSVAIAPAVSGAAISHALFFSSYGYFKDLFKASSPSSFGLSSACAGSLTAIATNPIWVVKTRLQAIDHRYSGMLDALRSIVRNEGVGSLWAGLVPSLMMVSHGVVQFTVYEELRKAASRLRSDEDSSLPSWVIAVTSAVSKIVALGFTYPIQLIRSRLQHRRSAGYYGAEILSVANSIHINEGIRGFYKGIIPASFRVVPSASLTLVVYENLVRIMHDKHESYPS